MNVEHLGLFSRSVKAALVDLGPWNKKNAHICITASALKKIRPDRYYDFSLLHDVGNAV